MGCDLGYLCLANQLRKFFSLPYGKQHDALEYMDLSDQSLGVCNAPH